MRGTEVSLPPRAGPRRFAAVQPPGGALAPRTPGRTIAAEGAGGSGETNQTPPLRTQLTVQGQGCVNCRTKAPFSSRHAGFAPARTIPHSGADPRGAGRARPLAPRSRRGDPGSPVAAKRPPGAANRRSSAAVLAALRPAYPARFAYFSAPARISLAETPPVDAADWCFSPHIICMRRCGAGPGGAAAEKLSRSRRRVSRPGRSHRARPAPLRTTCLGSRRRPSLPRQKMAERSRPAGWR